MFNKESRITACYIVRATITPDSRQSVDGLEICQACEALTGIGTIDGAQIISGLWRIYPLTMQARRFLEINGINFRGQALSVLDKNPFFSRGDGPTAKLVIGNILISVASSALKKQGVGIRSSIKDETYRDRNGQLTRFKTGRRFVYIDLPVSPLPKYIRIGANLLGLL